MRKRLYLKTIIIILALSIAVVFFAQNEKKPVKTPDYLIDGAKKIYVIDESRCSTNSSSVDSGGCYLIEGEETIENLRKELSQVHSDDTLHGCLCGGPDIHYYIDTGSEALSYLGLDCQKYLMGYDLPESILNVIIPSREKFVGKKIGSTYIVDIPLDMTEAEATKRFRGAGLLLITGGYWNIFRGCVPRERRIVGYKQDTAPVYLILKVGRFKVNDPKMDIFHDCPLRQDALRKAEDWLEKKGLNSFLIFPPIMYNPGGTFHSGGVDDEVFWSVGCYLNNARAVRKSLAKDNSCVSNDNKVSIELIEYRTKGQIKEKGYYQAALILSAGQQDKGLKIASKLIQGIGRITPLCERAPIRKVKEI